jgi:Thioredoxin domain-containing protein
MVSKWFLQIKLNWSQGQGKPRPLTNGVCLRACDVFPSTRLSICFRVENLESFLTKVVAGEVDPYIKSEPVPEDNSGPVKVAVAKNFDEVVTNNEKDVLVEFYAPWCGHCKKLTPVYEEVGEKVSSSNWSSRKKSLLTAQEGFFPLPSF